MIIPHLILGAGGHAKVLIDTLRSNSALIAGIVDPDPMNAGQIIFGVPVLGDDNVVQKFLPEEILLVNGLGSVGLPVKRRDIYLHFKGLGYNFAVVVHPSAVVASDVEFGEGTQVMAGAVIQPGSRLGCNVIINTRASVDHDGNIGDHAHIAPGVTLSGGVSIGRGSHVGTGATVIQGVSVGESSVVGAGALVLHEIPANVTAVGVPAKVVKR